MCSSDLGSKQSLHCPRVFTKESIYSSEIQLFDSAGSREQSLETGGADAYALMIDKFASDVQEGRHDLEAEKASIWCAEMTSAIIG